MSKPLNPQDIMDDFSKKMSILKADEDSLKRFMTSAPFIVVNHAGLPLFFTISRRGDETIADNPQIVSRPCQATHFSRQDAETVAANVFDGANRPGKAKTALQATRDSIKELQEVMNFLNEAMLKKAS